MFLRNTLDICLTTLDICLTFVPKSLLCIRFMLSYASLSVRNAARVSASGRDSACILTFTSLNDRTAARSAKRHSLSEEHLSVTRGHTQVTGHTPASSALPPSTTIRYCVDICWESTKSRMRLCFERP